MAGVVFWFEDNDRDTFSGRQLDLDAWRHALKAGGIDKARCFNISKFDPVIIGDDDYTIAGTSKKDYIDWVDQHKYENLLFVGSQNECPESAVTLKNVDHNQVDWYIFGRSNGILKTGHEKNFMYLPTKNNLALHSLHIASAVMLDRWSAIGVK